MQPVILLAFANDKQNTGAGYLRGLTLERNSIRDALMKAEENGLCQVVVEPDVTVDRLFDIFQNSAYRDRIAVFHYGGHAESYSLLLESASGGKAKAHSEGLVSFLAKQKSLKLVFLNGCSSQKQSEELVAAGLPAVIGTSQTINDTIATGLSTRFYKGLSAGMTVERAWTDSIDQIKTENKTTDRSSLFVENILAAPGEETFPWNLYVGEGGALSKVWNLPEAANQPLFGLELPTSYYRKLPVTPYPGLRNFQRDEAAIFFGRGQDIRKLHNLLHREQPVILLSGKKGVGKSSLLAAGLTPRIESENIVSLCYIEKRSPVDALEEVLENVREVNGLEKIPPKDKTKLEERIVEIRKWQPTLSGVAKEIVEQELENLIRISNKEHLSFYEQWISIEEQTGKPLIVIMDELLPNAEEWRVFREILILIFENKKPPRGKLILAVDEEDHGSFTEMLQLVKFPYAELFLQPLTWDGIKESIAGVTLSPITKEFYRLNIEAGGSNDLPVTLTGDLSDSDVTLVAPYLQVILSSMWASASADNSQAPSFTLRAYQQGILSGEILDRFLTQQLVSLKERFNEPVQSGLALDLLYQHTSALGKSNILETAKRKQLYADREEVINDMVKKCKGLFLINSAHAGSTNLGHNLLAHVVIRQYSISLYPGQQAARILNGKTGESAESIKSGWLSETDLEIVENGLKGMRLLTKEEESLLEYSRLKKIQVQKERKRNRIIRGVLASVVFVFAVIAAWQWYDANQKYLRSHAGELAFNASEALEKDNTIALNIALEAYSTLEENSPFLVMQTLSDIFHSQEEIPFYAANFPHLKSVHTAVFSPDGQNVLTASEDGFAILWDIKGKEVRRFPHIIEVAEAVFSPNGQQILTRTRTHITLWERNGKMTDRDSIPEDAMTNLDSRSTDGMKIIHTYTDTNASTYVSAVYKLRLNNRLIISSPAENRMLENNAGKISLLNELGDIVKDSVTIVESHAIFSPDGKQFLTIWPFADTSFISVWNENGDLLYRFKCKGSRVNAVFSPDGKSILTASNDFTAKLWDFSQTFVHRFAYQPAAMYKVDYYPEGNAYVTASSDYTVKIWDASGKVIDSLVHADEVTSAVFSQDGKRVLSASKDGTARIWSPREGKVVTLAHRGEVKSAVFSHHGQWVLTSSLDSLVRLWDLNGIALDSFRHNDEVIIASFSPDDSVIVSIAKDYTATLWNMKGDSLHIYRHPAMINSAEFSPDGSSLLTSCSDSLVRLWSTSDYQLIDSLVHLEKPRIAKFSMDGQRIITAGRMIKVWHDGMLEDSMVHSQNVTSIDLSPDGRQILATCNDQNGYLWDFNGELLARYENHTAKINFGCFTPDGFHVLTAADDGYIMRWKTPQAIFMDLQTTPLYRLSKKEEEQYGIVRSNITTDFLYRIKKSMSGNPGYEKQQPSSSNIPQ